MAASLWRLPGAPLRSSVARAAFAGMLVVLAYAPVVASETMSGADYIKRSVLFFAASVILIVGRIGSHHPFPRFGAANTVTLLRVSLGAGVAGFIGETPSDRIAWLVTTTVVVLALLDGLDGWLARRSAEQSAFGARFDMETDAALILILSALVWHHGKAGAWVLSCGAMRYAFIAAGWMLPWMAAPLRATLRGKTVAVVQFVGLGLALLPIVPVPYSDIAAAITLALLVWSFSVDIAWLKRKATGQPNGGARRIEDC